MAKLDIEVNVSGESQIDGLRQKTEGLGKSTKSLTGLYAGLAVAGVLAIKEMTEAGIEYHNQLQEQLGTLDTTKSKFDDMTTSFGMMSSSILDAVVGWENMDSAMVALSNTMDVIAGKEYILQQAKAESLAMEREYQAMLKENAKWKEEEHKKELARQKELDKLRDKDVKRQQALSKLEAKVREETARATEKARRELEEYNKTIKTYNELTEEQVNMSELAKLGFNEQGEELTKQEQMTRLASDAFKEYTAAVGESTNEVESNTNAVTENTNALSTNSNASNRRSSGSQGSNTYSESISFGEYQDRENNYALDLKRQGFTGEADRVLQNLNEAMLRELKRLNNKIGG